MIDRVRILTYSRDTGTPRITIHKKIERNRENNVPLWEGIEGVNNVELIDGIYFLHVDRDIIPAKTKNKRTKNQ